MFGQGVVGRTLGDDEALLQRLVLATFAGQFRVDRQGQCDDADLGIAGLYKLGGVRNVFAIDQLRLDLVPHPRCAQCFLGPFAIGLAKLGGRLRRPGSGLI